MTATTPYELSVFRLLALNWCQWHRFEFALKQCVCVLLFVYLHDVWLIKHHHMRHSIQKVLRDKMMAADHPAPAEASKKSLNWRRRSWRACEDRGSGEGGQILHSQEQQLCMQPYFSRRSYRLRSSAGSGRLVFELQPDSFVKTWTECDLFIKRRSVPWHLQHPLKWRCITYFTWRVKSHPSLRLSPSWNAVQLAGC